ncbi:type II toxin-antitoxin system RatA family toxin [Nocardia mexicana]|uniref:Ribosome-associated toxin RatA of RatAB toxin-antitoxin module n=1 Tax=Nocardia mexicana TaxID=279262 RepID=A0A370HFK3_9NOCA|nr:SRPBCC family protein [Nocardia mexicana]RDI55576.1 ribosome-associated toxin RatA of RatAB toxin-antitoxin module [Nocardia mexicana]
MQQVHVTHTMTSPIDEVWAAIKNITAYPAFMKNVEEVTLLDDAGPGGHRLSAWRVWLKGSILEWTEREEIDNATRTLRFEQIDGDLEIFLGYWRVEDGGDGLVRVDFRVEFEIGIPLLADMLNPVAATALRDNSTTMLREIESRVAAGGVHDLA